MTLPDTPLRIAVSSYYLPSESKIGAGHQAHGLAQALVRAGHDVTMFSPCRRPDDATYRHVQVPLSGSLRTFKWAFALRRQDFDDFDVFHAAGDDYWFWGKRRPAHVRTMHGSCLAEAVHIRGVSARVRMLALGLGEVLATFVADRTVLVSANTRRWFPWVRTVIPNGVDTTRFAPGDRREDVPTILFVGTYRNRKRGKLLMEVFAADVLPRLPDARLWMVCADAPDAPGVEVLGRLDEEALADRYRRAWVFCLPSTYEGFGVPYIEAMASGLPVVATPNVGAREILDGGRYGVLTEDAQLGTALADLLDDAPRREHLATQGHERSAIYSWERVVAQYRAVYDDAAAGRRARRVARRPSTRS